MPTNQKRSERRDLSMLVEMIKKGLLALPFFMTPIVVIICLAVGLLEMDFILIASSLGLLLIFFIFLKIIMNLSSREHEAADTVDDKTQK